MASTPSLARSNMNVSSSIDNSRCHAVQIPPPKKTILLLALEFAPVETAGAFRSIAFAKYLAEHGYSAHVVSILPEEACRVFNANINYHLNEGLEDEIKISRMRSSEPLLPDTKLRRFLRIYTKLNDRFYSRYRNSLLNQISSIKFDPPVHAVLASLPPFGAARLGEMVARELGVPLVLDMRDSWAEWEIAPYPTYLHYSVQRRAEAHAFSAACAIIATTSQMRSLFRRCHTKLESSKFYYIPNGFEGSLFHQKEIVLDKPNGSINIAYVGNYYYSPPRQRSIIKPYTLVQFSRGKEDWSYRSPEYFFRAWKELYRTDPCSAGSIQFHHIGPTPPWLEGMIARHGLQKSCKFWGTVPKQKLAGVLDDMDVLLATSMKRLDGEDYFLASKTFDYLRAEKLILAFVTNGAQHEFLLNTGIAMIADPDDESQSASLLKRLVREPLTATLNSEFINQFHRRNTTTHLADLLDRYT